MTLIPLDDLRCRRCDKLLLKGTLGLGVVEVKCVRCGEMNLFHSLDDLIAGRVDTYILVFDNAGIIVASSSNVGHLLGYNQTELMGMPMVKLNPDFKLPEPELLHDYNIGGNNASGKSLGTQTYDISHIKKDRGKLHVIARYYPFGSFSGNHTMIILSVKS